MTFSDGAVERLRALIAKWRNLAMITGQYSVECPTSEEGENAREASVRTECADELSALLVSDGGLPQELYDRAGEWESIKALVADREEMTVYLKVEAALSELEKFKVGGLLPAPAEEDNGNFTVGVEPWTDEQIEQMWAMALKNDVQSARRLLEQHGYTVALPAQAPHRCSGCGHRWEVPTGFILNGAELCGDCWRKAQPVLHFPAPAPPLTEAQEEFVQSLGEIAPVARELLHRMRSEMEGETMQVEKCQRCGKFSVGWGPENPVDKRLPAQAPRGET